VIKKSSATHRKEFFAKISPKLMRGKNITFREQVQQLNKILQDS
jgi:hypothetical protein